MRITSLASGSSGNCVYVGTDTTHLLVDVGISGKRVLSGIEQLDLSIRDIDGILITHEHTDHIYGLGVISRKFGIPIYTTAKTKEAILNCHSLGPIDECLFNEVKADTKLSIKDIIVNPMKISHDAVDPVAYRFQHGNRRVSVVTDLGKYTDYTVESLKNMDVLFLEANHDVNMLQVGPYPYYLKQRILGDRGHLSNENAGSLLFRILNDNLKAVFLGHLSKENNMPELAYESVRCEVNIKQQNSDYKGIGMSDIPMYVAKRDTMSHIVEIA
ncbi:MAG: MBL fold metallo-hydrolase [Lachnospiraceae bacterium]|nr:MBL fold metallo-hydrolase [Lachnospiraceae bacterium]